MGQTFKIVNLDKGQQLNIKSRKPRQISAGSGKLYTLLLNRDLEQLVDLPTVRSFKSYRPRLDDMSTTAAQARKSFLQSSPEYVPRKHTEPASNSTASRLIALPQELLDQIISIHTRNCQDRSKQLLSSAHLALTCTYLFRLLTRTLRTGFEQVAAYWSHDRLICVGDYARGIPANCADIDTTPTLEEERTFDDPGDEYARERFLNNPLFNRAWKDVKCPSDPVRSAIQHLRPALSDEETGILTRLYEFVRPPSSDCPGVLRSHVTRTYVRDAVLASSGYACSLGEVLCTQVLWTHDSSGVEYGLKCRGEWVGGRFDIVGEGAWQEDGWRDVSGEALEWLASGTQGYGRDDGRRALI